MIDVNLLRRQFAKVGFNMEIGKGQMKALSKTKFRGYERGKGAAVAIIIGVDNVDTLEAKLLELSAGGPRIVSKKTERPIEGSENRGLR